MNKYNDFKVGEKVHFVRKVFTDASYVPHYNAYATHQFEVVALHEGDHIELKCLDADVKVNGRVHTDELRRTK